MKRVELYKKLIQAGIDGRNIWRTSGDKKTWRLLVHRGLVVPVQPICPPRNYRVTGQCCFRLTETGRNFLVNGGNHNVPQIC